MKIIDSKVLIDVFPEEILPQGLSESRKKIRII